MLAKLRKKDQEYIKHIVQERDLPGWYRGLSIFQRRAADSLLNSIRDDCEQETSHRTRDVLRLIGIEPLVGPSKLKFIMKLSRGNDIAFLWFLMEMYYRTSPDRIGPKRKYSINEQMFLSTIAYLDVVPTLRELNKMLPKQIKIKKAPHHPVLEKKKKRKHTSASVVSPYFEKLPIPKEFGTKLTMNESSHIANFAEYRNYLNPNYIAFNEHNRWFSNFIIDKNKKLVRGLLSAQIDSILSEEKPLQSFSLYDHRNILEEMKKNFADALMVAKKNACENYFDVEKHCQRESYKRIMKQLNSDIDRIEKELKTSNNKNFPLEKKASTQGKQKKTPKQDSEKKSSDELYNYGHALPIRSKAKHFCAPTGNKPYKFNYERIFNIGTTRDIVKDAFATALNSDSSGKMSIEQNRAIKNYCETTWKKAVEKYKKSEKIRQHNLFLATQNQKKEKALALIKARSSSQTSKMSFHSQGRIKTAVSRTSIRRLSEKQKENMHPQHEYKLDLNLKNERDGVPYDPRDTALMDMILRSGLKELRKNNSYILAALPDAYKFPVLREWTKRRYGMKYTREERTQAFIRTKKVFQIVRRNPCFVRLPNYRDVSKKEIVSYGCHDYILAKTNFLKYQYEDRLKRKMMYNSRNCWGAIGMYQCTHGPPRSEFFAYMPPRKKDIHVFRPWKPTEFMHAKEAWEKRQSKIRQQVNY